MSNILEPVVDAVYRYIKWTYNVWFGNDDFNFKDFFMKVIQPRENGPIQADKNNEYRTVSLRCHYTYQVHRV